MDFYLWFIVALAFFILEILTPGFVLMWFGAGALVSGLLDVFGIHNLTVQILVFAITSIILVTLSRTIFKNIFMRASPGAGLNTTMDAVLGKVGVVTEKIDPDLSVGRVLIEGQDWAAITEDKSTIDVNVKIHVIGFEGARLQVKKM